MRSRAGKAKKPNKNATQAKSQRQPAPGGELWAGTHKPEFAPTGAKRAWFSDAGTSWPLTQPPTPILGKRSPGCFWLYVSGHRRRLKKVTGVDHYKPEHRAGLIVSQVEVIRSKSTQKLGKRCTEMVKAIISGIPVGCQPHPLQTLLKLFFVFYLCLLALPFPQDISLLHKSRNMAANCPKVSYPVALTIRLGA